MGVVADAALSEGGTVIGVLPKALQDKEVGHAGLTELHIVGSMHERKAMMADLSNGFVALPGGVGTLDHLADGIEHGHAEAVLAASIFHFGEYTVAEAKQHMAGRGVPVRLPPDGS